MSGSGPGPTVSARRTAGPLAGSGEFTYTVLTEVAAARSRVDPGGERRADARQRTRLRSGKIVDAAGRFVAECLIANRSSVGGLLRLADAPALPARILLYDDQSGDLTPAAIVWRRERELGVRFLPADRTERHRAVAEAMRRKYYAIRT